MRMGGGWAAPGAWGLVLLALIPLAPAVTAQEEPSNEETVSGTWMGPQMGPLLGFHWDRVQLVTASLGTGALWCRDRRPTGGLLCAGGFVLASPGWRGGEVTAGAIAILPSLYSAVAPGLSLLRGWNGPTRIDEGTTYLGPRLRVAVIPIGVSLAWYWRIAGAAGTHDRVWVLAVGIGMP